MNSDIYALVPSSDHRVQEIVQAYPNFGAYINRFQDTHSNPIAPTIMLRKTDIPLSLKSQEVAASFRDLVVASTVPIARALETVHNTGLDRVRYSSYFWIFPWVIDRNYEYLITRTPAMLALDDVDQFLGVSSPDLPRVTLRKQHVDEPLLEELLRRWILRYENVKPKWADIALFRSLHMANQACLVPAGVDAVIHDFGRLVALWVSAFEILVHPGNNERSNLTRVMDLFEKIPWQDTTLSHRRYLIKDGKHPERKNIACWLYRKLYSCRNDFLHGNPVTLKSLQILKSGRSLHFHAAILYRLALTAFLDLEWKEAVPPFNDKETITSHMNRRWRFENPQSECERALKLSRISVEQQRRDRENRINESFRLGREIKKHLERQ